MEGSGREKDGKRGRERMEREGVGEKEDGREREEGIGV